LGVFWVFSSLQEELFRELLGNTFNCHVEQRVVRNDAQCNMSQRSKATDVAILARLAKNGCRQGWPEFPTCLSFFGLTL
jgi:hypothetical protein